MRKSRRSEPKRVSNAITVTQFFSSNIPLNTDVNPSLTDGSSSVSAELSGAIHGNVGELLEGAIWWNPSTHPRLPPDLTGYLPRKATERRGCVEESLVGNARVSLEQTNGCVSKEDISSIVKRQSNSPT